MIPPIISAENLNRILDDSNLIILDASQSSNKAGESPKFENGRIKGSRYFDLKNAFSKQNARFPNTFPTKEQFEDECRKLGIKKSSKIVVYDNLGVYSSPRVWWLFKTMGHENISVLDGGLPEWIKQGYLAEENQLMDFELGDFESNVNVNAVKDFDFVRSNSIKPTSLVIDARSEGRFNGTAPEPRKEIKSGHIPNSVNLPFGEVLTEGKFKSRGELKQIFNKLVSDDTPLVFSCGSGLTACIILLAAELVTENEKSIYDGSWTEWAQLENVN